jgi:cobalt-zinc-cadmium efflux system outer membrane protein
MTHQGNTCFYRSLLLGLLVLWSWSGMAAAAEEPTETNLDLSALIREAVEHNPEIQAAEQRYRAAQARPSQAGSLPDPMIEGAYHNEPITPFTLGRSDFSFLRFGASQEFPFPGKLSLREDMAARDAAREEQMLRTTSLSVISRLTVAYADLVFTYQALEILQRNKSLLQDLQQSAEARYQVGQGIQQDVIKAQVEVSLLTSRLLQLEGKREGFRATINGLLNRPLLAPLGKPVPLPQSRFILAVEDVQTLALKHAPELKGAELAITRNELNLSLAQREYYPDLVFKADYMNKAARLPEWEVGVGVKVPLYFWRKQRYGVLEAAAGVGEARNTRQNVIQSLLARVKDLYVQARTAEQLTTLYHTAIIPQSRLSFESASAGYTVGKVDFLTLLNNILVLREAELSYEEQRTEFDKGVAQLEEITGSSLKETGSGGTP